MDKIVAFFNSDNFMPHGHCFLWQRDILWLHVISDAGIALAYYLIPVLLFYLIKERDDLPYKVLFAAFSTFILLCGTTHILAIWVLWHPDYAVEGIVKALTAIVSLATLFILWNIIPKILRVINPELLRQDTNTKRLNAILNNTLDGLITIDAKGKVESFNLACEHIFGYQAREVIGQNIKMLMPEPYHSGHDGYLSHYHKTGQAKIIGTAGREVSARRKDGSVFPMDLSVSAFELEDGKHFSGIIRDITERKEAEEKLKRYTGELERSNQELDDFAYIASHDLKEPLRGLFNNAKFLQTDYKDKLDAEGGGRLERLGYLCQRMETLVNDLLYFSRLGRQELAIQPTDLNAVIYDIESMMETTLREKNAAILLPHSLPTITCDKPRVTELFRNLITNAVKYNEREKKTVEIGYEDNVFYVRDNGIGIEEEFYEEIFRIFKRLNEEDDDKKGTGVGLTFVRKIVERHGGRIWLESAPGEGTTFYFTLT